MRKETARWYGLICVGLAALLGGCSRDIPPPQAMPADQVVPAMEKVFKDAQPELKKMAADFNASFKGNDPSRAFMALQTLNSRTELSVGQREVVTRSLLTVNEKLQAAAAQGEAKAGEVMQNYRSQR